MKTKILSFVSNIFFISIVVTIISIYFIPNYFTKYTVNLIEETYTTKSNIYFEDLDGDHNAEKIGYHKNTAGNAAIMIWDDKNSLIGQWNYLSKRAERSPYLGFYDIDGNDSKEIYFVSHRNDSAFLNITEPIAFKGIKKEIYLDSIGRYDGENDLKPSDFTFYKQEVFLTISSGYSGTPRNLYAYNFNSDVVKKSIHLTNYCNISEIVTDDKAKEKIIVLRSASAGNKLDSTLTKRSDSRVWIQMLTKNLEFLFEPIEFKTEYGSTHMFVLNNSSKQEFIGLINSNQYADFPSRLVKLSSKGEILKEHLLSDNQYFLIKNFRNDEILLYDKIDRIVGVCDENLEQRVLAKDLLEGYLKAMDIDADGKNEWINSSKNNRDVRIYRSNFKEFTQFELPTNTSRVKLYSLKQISKKHFHLYFQNDTKLYVYEYATNAWYYFKYLVYIGIYLLVIAVTKLIVFGQKLQEAKKRGLENQISELQLKTIKNQVDPHFVFNAINTISEMTLMDNKLEADDFICRFSDFMRSTLAHSDKISTTLKEELIHVENFIKLQQIRFKDKFSYKITIAKGVDKKIQVPKQVLFTYVENAIKYGFSTKEKGLLELKVSKIQNGLVLLVLNNGGGLKKNPTNKISTGNGVKIMNQIFELYTKLYKRKIEHAVSEIKNQKGAIDGVQVKITIFD